MICFAIGPPKFLRFEIDAGVSSRAFPILDFPMLHFSRDYLRN